MEQSNTDNDATPLVKPRLRNADAGRLRKGKGFSYGEISGAKASVQDVRTAGLPIDHLRRSVHDFNVKSLRDLLGNPTGGAATSKSGGASKKSRGKAQRGAKSKGSKVGRKK